MADNVTSLTSHFHLWVHTVPQHGHLGGWLKLDGGGGQALGTGLQQEFEDWEFDWKDETRQDGPQLVIGPEQYCSVMSSGPFFLIYSATCGVQVSFIMYCCLKWHQLHLAGFY